MYSMLQNAPDFYQKETSHPWLRVVTESWSKAIKQSKKLLSSFSIKKASKRFVAFLQEECTDLWLDEKKITLLINRLSKHYIKKDSVKDLNPIISAIESLLTNQRFIDRLDSYLSDSTMTNFAKMFFYKNGKITCNNLQNNLLSRVKRYNLSSKAISDLSKKELLDVLQVNNRFKWEDSLNHKVIDVRWRWKDRIYLLQNYKTAKMVDGKLVLLEDIEANKKIAYNEAIEHNKEIADDQNIQEEEKTTDNEHSKPSTYEAEIVLDETDVLATAKAVELGELWLPEGQWLPEIENKDIPLHKIHQQEKIWISWKTYTYIENTSKSIDRSRKSIHVMDSNWKTYRFISMPDWSLLDNCKWNDWKDYEIIDYVSANQNTGSFDIVSIKDINNEEQNLRLLVPEYWKFIIQKNILIEKKWLKNWFMKNNLIQLFYKLIGKESYEPHDTFDIKDFSWDGNRQDYIYTLSNWEKISMDSAATKKS